MDLEKYQKPLKIGAYIILGLLVIWLTYLNFTYEGQQNVSTKTPSTGFNTPPDPSSYFVPPQSPDSTARPPAIAVKDLDRPYVETEEDQAIRTGGVPKLTYNRNDTSFLLDQGSTEMLMIHNQKCSKSCCGSQWPPSFPLERDPAVCASGADYVPSNFSCSNEYTTGCVCMPRKAYNFLSSKGGNQPL